MRANIYFYVVFFIANNEQTNLKKENNTRPSTILASY